MHILLRWLISALSLMFVAYLVPSVQVDSFYAALIAALVLGLVNALVRPIFILLTLPINLLTLGLFTLVINGFMLWLVSTAVKGFTITSFVGALWAAIILWLVGWITNSITDAKKAE